MFAPKRRRVPTDGQTADRITTVDGDGLEAVACECYWLQLDVRQLLTGGPAPAGVDGVGRSTSRDPFRSGTIAVELDFVDQAASAGDSSTTMAS